MIEFWWNLFPQGLVLAMPLTDPQLWKLIEAWPLRGSLVPRSTSSAPQELPFSQSLAEEHDLYRASAEGVEAEYRRWLYLCAAQGKRMQGSGWMAKAERHHRKDSANWQAMTEALPAKCLEGSPTPRSRDNGAAYAETLASYLDTFPNGAVFPKVWPARWREDLSIWLVLWPLIVTMIGLALSLRGSGSAAMLGGLIFVVGVIALTVGFSSRPWQNDDHAA